MIHTKFEKVPMKTELLTFEKVHFKLTEVKEEENWQLSSRLWIWTALVWISADARLQSSWLDDVNIFAAKYEYK